MLHGVLVLLVFSMVLAIWGFLEAVIAALLIMFLPRALFHASLACFDAPIMTLWFATIYAYWRVTSPACGSPRCADVKARRRRSRAS